MRDLPDFDGLGAGGKGEGMSHLNPLFSSASVEWNTPKKVYEALDAEFHFTLDPCTKNSLWDGRAISWHQHRVYCNPPYGPQIGTWLQKAPEAEVAVYLLPARTDTRWFHNFCLLAKEIRFIRGRLKFGDAKHNAPFPSMIVIF